MGNIEVESSRQIKLGALVSYIGIIINIVAGLLYTPWMINQIGQDNFGLYTLATSLISIFLIDFGLGAAVSRFVSKYVSENDQDSINNMLGITYKIYIIIDLILLLSLIVVYFNLDMIYKELTPSELTRFETVYIIAAMFSVISFPFITLNGILTSYEKFIQLKICDLFQKLLSIILITLALLNGYGLYALVAANAVSGLIIILIKLIIIKRGTTININLKYSSKGMVKDILSFSIWSTVVSVAQRLIFNITPSILGSISGSVSIALFGIASALEGYVYTIANAINGLFLPRVTRLITRDNSSSNLLQLMIKVGRIQLLIIGLIAIGFITVGSDFIVLWVGEEYLLSYYSAILLILPSIIYLPQQIGNTAIVALNKMKLQAYVFLVMSVINITLSVILSIYWGVLGASLAIFISYNIRNIGMNLIYHKVINLNMVTFFKECHIKLMVPLFISLMMGLIVNLLLPNISWLYLMLKVFYVVITYLIIMWLFAMNSYEKNLLKSVIKKMILKIY
ncbi:oligosaccharide flippase family protein [[Bacillus] enclensis]|uniref:oligosaccharide flippase family protein n=1 Tax=[Bacillus] enclensis TaxID=1402860 RepID=UPI0018DDA692|nr:oligosaccharide flippase family protein [[Bacillus] enclensis]MBH9967913.1 oligosaccharide flippase family protein [[Bacillus] enclensis]